MKYWNYIIILALSIIGSILRLIDLNVGLGFGDEYVHYQATMYILKSPVNILHITVLLAHAPLMWAVLPIFYKLLLPVFGDTILISRIASAISGTFFILIIYILMKKDSEQSAVVSAALVSLGGYMVVLSRIGYPDMFIVIFFTLLLFAFLKYLKNISLKNSVLFGFFFGFVILLKETAIILFFSIILFVLWERRDLILNKTFWLGILLPFIIFIPVIIFLIVVILPNYVSGVGLLNFLSFYQSYYGRNMYLSNIPFGVFDQVFNFIAYSSVPFAAMALFGVLYALWKRTTKDKFFLSVIASYLLLFSGMGRAPIAFSQYPSFLKTEFPQYDWHMWWVIPVLILASNAIIESYKNYIEPRLTKNTKLWLIIFVLAFIAYIIMFDLEVIQTYNEYMKARPDILKITRTL